jgi:hypothetical protein
MKHFKESEFYDFSKMDKDFLARLDAFRAYVGSRCIITSSNEPHHEHQPNSQHYKNLAVDCVFPDWQGSLFSLYLIAERFGFSGIGLYPRWKFKDKQCGGLHLDCRVVENYQNARWIGIPKDNKNIYFPLTMKFLKELKIIN